MTPLGEYLAAKATGDFWHLKTGKLLLTEQINVLSERKKLCPRL